MYDIRKDETSRNKLLEAVPNANTRFYKHCKGLKDLLDEINKHFPEAHYTTHMGDMILKLYEYDDNDYVDAMRATALADYSGLIISAPCEYV